MSFFNRTIFLLLLAIIFFSNTSVRGDQPDSLTKAANKRANRTALMSAVLPGLGQIQNRKYWKLPILYGASGTLLYFINANNAEYKKFRQALIFRTDENPTTVDEFPRFTNEDLTVRKDYYRRNRDLCYILAGVLYALNVIDAYVDSQMMNFDISDDLSLHTGFRMNYLDNGTSAPAIGLVFNFK